MPFETVSLDTLFAEGDSGDAAKGISAGVSVGGVSIDGLLSVGLTSTFSKSQKGCTCKAKFLVAMPPQWAHKID